MVFDWNPAENGWLALHFPRQRVLLRECEAEEAEVDDEVDEDEQPGGEADQWFEVLADGMNLCYVHGLPGNWHLRGGPGLPAGSFTERSAPRRSMLSGRQGLMRSLLIDGLIFVPGFLLLPQLIELYGGGNWQNMVTASAGMAALCVGTFLLRRLQPGAQGSAPMLSTVDGAPWETEDSDEEPVYSFGWVGWLAWPYILFALMMYTLIGTPFDTDDVPGSGYTPEMAETWVGVPVALFFIGAIVYAALAVRPYQPRIPSGTVLHDRVGAWALALIDIAMLLQYALIKGFRQRVDPELTSPGNIAMVWCTMLVVFLVAYAPPRLLAMRALGQRWPSIALYIAALGWMSWHVWILNR